MLFGERVPVLTVCYVGGLAEISLQKSVGNEPNQYSTLTKPFH